MKITVNNIELDCWDNPYPIWINIRQGGSTIMIRHNEVLAVRDALTSLIKEVKSKMDEAHKDEVV